MLDGQRVIEIKVAAGAQTPAGLAGRLSSSLKRLADDNTRLVDQIIVVEEPPYWMVAEKKADGEIVPGLAVDERAAQSFGISQRALAEQYRDQLRAAVQQYRSRRNPEAWLRGTMLALLVLGSYVTAPAIAQSLAWSAGRQHPPNGAGPAAPSSVVVCHSPELDTAPVDQLLADSVVAGILPAHSGAGGGAARSDPGSCAGAGLGCV
jgi:hypothetical protein